MRKSMFKYGMIIFAVFVIFLFSACSPVPDLSFTEKITVEYTTHNENLRFEIISSNDINKIIEAFTEDAKRGSGDCGFDIVKLIFEGENKKVTLLPAGDNCDTVKYADINYDKYYLMGAENKAKLIRILQKYGTCLITLNRTTEWALYG
jgi:hypothetical protein